MKTNNVSRAAILCLTGVLSFGMIGCKGKHNKVTVENEEPDTAPRMVSTLRMNDAQSSAQLLSGFYGIEAGTWRWTANKFSVLLRTPPVVGQQGATVTLNFTLPDVVVKKLKSFTLSASVDGMVLKSADYNAPGAYVFTADVPASALTGDSVKVDFAMDKPFQPDNDRRVLGIVANSVGIASK